MQEAGALEQVREWLSAAQRVTVFTGAGISTDSGIPDYRGPNGVWTRNPEAQRMSSIQDYVADPEVRRRAWQSRKAHPAWSAEPNDAHRALADLERTGRLTALITQNIDELHQRAGSSREKVIELHGTIWWAECLTCGVRSPMADELARVSDVEPDPSCTLCGGILKSATISFGQPLDAAVLRAAWAATQACDLFVAIGTSLMVHPAAGLCEVAVEAGARFVIINAEPTPYDDIAGTVLREPIGEILPALVAAVVEERA
ncbi:MAG TPA: NAD-dependent protein deacylase [Mycobacteriales bacterium]|nr:NAD-dependent protein deacylase [Mycobacteriales bacterium]